MRARHGAPPSQRPPTFYEEAAVDHKMSTPKHGMPPRGRSLTDPDLLLHIQSPSCSTPSTVRSTAPRRPRIEPSDFTMPLIPTIRADSPLSTHSRDPRLVDDLEPPRPWNSMSRGSQPNSPSIMSACPSPTPSATPSTYSVRLKTSSGGGEASGSRLQRKKSNASLLVKRGLTRMGSVMSRKGASSGGREGSRHGQQSSTSTPPRRRLPRNNSLTLDDLVEESNSCASSTQGLTRVQSPLQPLLPSQICQSKVETGGVSRPFNVQHQLHVTENLEGLPMEWLDQLKAQGMSESELLLIVAAHKKQRSVPLHPVNPVARRKPVPSFTVGDDSAPSPSPSPQRRPGVLGDAQEDVSVTLRPPQRQGLPSHEITEPAEARKIKEKPSLTIQVPPRERPKVQLEQGHSSPPSQHAPGATIAPTAPSLTAAGSTLTWPRGASKAAPALPDVPTVTAAPTAVSPPKTGPEPSPQPLEASARSPTSASLPPTPSSISTSSKTGRRSRALSTHLKRSSSIITKLLTDHDPVSSRAPRANGQHLLPHPRADNVSGFSADAQRKGEHARGASNVSANSHLTVASASSGGRRMSDEIRGFQNLNIDLTDGDEWAASILAAWDEEGGAEGVPERAEGLAVAPAPLQEEGTDPDADYVPEEAEIRVVRPPITKQASMISLRAVMEDAEERKERPRPKSISLDRVYSPPPPPRPFRVASPVSPPAPPASEPGLAVPTTSSSRLRCVSVDSFGVQRRDSQTPTTSPSSSEVDLSTPPLDETASAVIALPKPLTQPLRLTSPHSSPTPPLRILRSPRSSMNRSSSGQSLNVSAHRSRPSSQASKRDVHLSPSAQSLNHARLSLQAKTSGSADSPSLYSPRSSRHHSPIRASYATQRNSLPRPPPSRPPPDVPRSNTETTEGTSTATPQAQAFPSTGSFLPFSEEEVHSPAEVSTTDHRPEAFSLPTSADSLTLEYTQHQRGQEHIRGQESIQSIESLFASSGALGLVLNLDGVNNRLSEGGSVLSRVSSCSSANYSYQLHEATVQRAYTRVLRRARESVHDLGGDVDEVSSESAYGDDSYVGQDIQVCPGHRSTPSGPTGVTPVDPADGMFANARLIRVNELDDPEDGYHTAYASPRFDTNRMSIISGYSGSVYHSVSSATEPDFQSAGQSTQPPHPISSRINSPSPLGQLSAQAQPV